MSYHLQAAKAGLIFFVKKPLTTIITTLVIALTLTLPTFFWVLSDNLQRLTLHWQNSERITLYLKLHTATQQEHALLDRIRSMRGIEQVVLKSATEGLAEFQSQEGMQEMMRYLPENPLPAVIDITPTHGAYTAQQLDELSLQLKKESIVDQVKLNKVWITQLEAILNFLNKLSCALMVLLAVAVLLIIGNTLRFAVRNKHLEIQVLKLIGASDSFIIRPFLYSGMGFGLMGGAIAIVLVSVLMWILTSTVNQLAMIYQIQYPVTGLSFDQVIGLLLLSMGLGWLGAGVSVKRQLTSIEPCDAV